METRSTKRVGPNGDGFLEIENAATNSIEVTRNAKGDYQWSIKVYFRPDEDRADVLTKITDIDTALKRFYTPMAAKENSDGN